MINWIIIFIALSIWIEGEKYAIRHLKKISLSFETLNIIYKDLIALNTKTLYDQLYILNIKQELKKYSGNFWVKLFYHIFGSIVIYGMVQDGVNVFIALGLILVLSLTGSVNYIFKSYGYIKETLFFYFVYLYIWIYSNYPFYFLNYQLNFILMLPFFLIWKIVYNNIRLFLRGIYDSRNKNR